MKIYGIKYYGNQIRMVKIGLSDDCVYLVDDDVRVVLGSSVERTRKGFYFEDIFFKRQFVSWSRLVPLD